MRMPGYHPFAPIQRPQHSLTLLKGQTYWEVDVSKRRSRFHIEQIPQLNINPIGNPLKKVIIKASR